MRIVLVGARSRSELADTGLVNQIVDACKEKYNNLLIVVASCDKGVGQIVKSRNIDVHVPGKYEFDMIELRMLHYLHRELPRTEFISHWNALNATLVELGDEFHILTDEKPKGGVMDLIIRLRNTSRPFATYKPSEVKNGPKQPTLGG